MAFTEFYAQTTGSNLNAGSTTADAASLTYASGNWVAATGVFTVASGAPSSDGVVVGDFVSVYANGSTVTGFVGRVTARDATTITVSLAAVSGTPPTDGTGSRTLKVGGAWKGPNSAEAFPFGFVAATLTNASVDFPRVNFKSGTNFAITAAMTHSIAGPVRFQGYTATPGDGGRATIDGGTSGASFTHLTLSGVNNDLVDLTFQNNGATGSASCLVLSGGESLIRRVVVNSVRGMGFQLQTTASTVVECEAYGCNQSNTAATAGFNNVVGGSIFVRCIAHDNTGSNTGGFRASAAATFINCIADTNGNDGFMLTFGSGQCAVIGCDSYNNGGDGIDLANGSAVNFYLENCNLIKNGAYGINGSGAGSRNGAIFNCGFGSGTQANTSGTTTGPSAMVETGSVNYAADVTPWVDPANGDFRVNLATAKGAGRGSFTQTASSYAGAVGYPDIGAAQHRDASYSRGRLVNAGA